MCISIIVAVLVVSAFDGTRSAAACSNSKPTFVFFGMNNNNDSNGNCVPRRRRHSDSADASSLLLSATAADSPPQRRQQQQQQQQQLPVLVSQCDVESDGRRTVTEGYDAVAAAGDVGETVARVSKLARRRLESVLNEVGEKGSDEVVSFPASASRHRYADRNSVCGLPAALARSLLRVPQAPTEVPELRQFDLGGGENDVGINKDRTKGPPLGNTKPALEACIEVLERWRTEHKEHHSNLTRAPSLRFPPREYESFRLPGVSEVPTTIPARRTATAGLVTPEDEDFAVVDEKESTARWTRRVYDAYCALVEVATADRSGVGSANIPDSANGCSSIADSVVDDLFTVLGKAGVLRLLGYRCTVGTVDALCPGVGILLESFQAPYRPNHRLTAGARALSKHCARNRPEGDGDAAFWPRLLEGNDGMKNAAALKTLVDGILRQAAWVNLHVVPTDTTASSSSSSGSWGNCFGGNRGDDLVNCQQQQQQRHHLLVPVLEIRNPQGYGARWSADGMAFRGFLEPLPPFHENGRAD